MYMIKSFYKEGVCFYYITLFGGQDNTFIETSFFFLFQHFLTEFSSTYHFRLVLIILTYFYLKQVGRLKKGQNLFPESNILVYRNLPINLMLYFMYESTTDFALSL